jgi:hypothetical protein
MDGKAKFIFPVLMTAIIVFMVSAVVTGLNLGFRADYFASWMRAFFIAWPLAALASFVAIPVARTLTRCIVARLDGTA